MKSRSTASAPHPNLLPSDGRWRTYRRMDPVSYVAHVLGLPLINAWRMSPRPSDGRGQGESRSNYINHMELTGCRQPFQPTVCVCLERSLIPTFSNPMGEGEGTDGWIQGCTWRTSWAYP